MTVLSSGLETITYGQPGWNFLFNRNFELLNNKLLKFSALLDFLGTPTNGQVPVWDSTASKWKPRSF